MLAYSPDFFLQKILQYFSLRDSFFVCFCLAAWRSKLVGGMCSMLPYGTGICCHAFIEFFLYCFIVSVIPFLYFKKSGIDKSTEWSTIPACPSLMYFFFLTGAIPKGLILWKFCVSCFCIFLFYMGLCQDWFCGFWIVCGLMTCVQSKWKTDWTLFSAVM